MVATSRHDIAPPLICVALSRSVSAVSEPKEGKFYKISKIVVNYLNLTFPPKVALRYSVKLFSQIVWLYILPRQYFEPSQAMKPCDPNTNHIPLLYLCWSHQLFWTDIRCIYTLSMEEGSLDLGSFILIGSHEHVSGDRKRWHIHYLLSSCRNGVRSLYLRAVISSWNLSGIFDSPAIDTSSIWAWCEGRIGV